MTTNNGNPPPLKPYLINAVLDYCRNTGTTPYVMVAVDDACSVPREFVRDGRIIFDLTDEAVNRLEITDDWLTFQARFGETNDIFDVEAILLMSGAHIPPLGFHCGRVASVKAVPTKLQLTRSEER